MKKLIVSDTGSLITSEKTTFGSSLLKLLYDEILITHFVAKELIHKQNFNTIDDYLKYYNLDTITKIVKVRINRAIDGIIRLDRGEQEVISLAIKDGLDLMIEERLGKRIAINNNIKAFGFASRVVYANRQELIDKSIAKSYLDELLKIKRINLRIYNPLVSDLV